MPQYKLENHETWPENGSLNYNSILQLDIFAKGRETRQVHYIKAFMALRENL